MRAAATLALLLLPLSATAFAATAYAADTPKALSFDAQRKLVNDYCTECHNFEDWAGSVELLTFDPAKAGEHAELAEKIILKLRSGQMPPAGKPRPDFASGMEMAESLEETVDKAALAKYLPGRPGLHRLNRVEYSNVIHDLLGLDVDTTKLLPVDDSSHGFDNQADTLGLSPVLLEAYLSAAGKISRLAVGDVKEPTQTLFRVAQDETQNYHVNGLPFGTRGGTLIHHDFPVDGKYTIKVFAVMLGNMGNFRPFGQVTGEKLEILVDGKRVGLIDWDKAFGVGARSYQTKLRTADLDVKVSAGPHDIGVTFLATNYAPGLDLNNAFDRSTIETGGIPGFTFYPHVGSVRIDGPYNPGAAADSKVRDLLFVCTPKSVKEEPACARKIVANLARRAYRGNVDDGDIKMLMSFYNNARKSTGSFDHGVEAALQRALSDPKFIYRVEALPKNVAADKPYAITDLELASRLSFFLWSSMPDDELLSVAEKNQLHKPKVLKAQVKRMLADPKSMELTKNFAGQWLDLRALNSHVPITAQFPDFDNNLRRAFRTEAELFFDSLIREDHSVVDMLNADYTFVNDRLAKYYGIPGIVGSRFQRVHLDDKFAIRRGLLGKGAILTATSQPGRTSPVERGKWVMSALIGSPPPPPPPDVPAIKPKVEDGAGNAHVPTLREQFEAHRANPACVGCHRMMDPIGFSLEPFDATGRFRTQDGGNPINAKDVLYDGTPVNGPADLRNFLLKYKDQFVRTLTEKLTTYAVGRGMKYEDMPVVRSIVHQAAKDDYKFQSLIMAVVQSEPFLMNSLPKEDEQAMQKAEN